MIEDNIFKIESIAPRDQWVKLYHKKDLFMGQSRRESSLEKIVKDSFEIWKQF